MTVGIGIIDYRGFKHLRKIPRTDAIVMVVVLLLTVFVGLLQAVAIGMVMASLLFMKSISDVIEKGASSAPLRSFSEEIPWSDEGTLLEEVGNKVFIKHLEGALFFGFASRFQEMVKALPNVELVIMRMGKVPYVDQSGLYAMEEAVSDLQAQNVAVIFTGLGEQPENMFNRIQLIPGLVPAEHSFKTFEEATAFIKNYLQKHGSLRSLASYQLHSNGRKVPIVDYDRSALQD
jgi:SulP family sulfate permease